MTVRWTCHQGHQWEAPGPGAAAPCPQCGAAAMPAPPGPPAEATEAAKVAPTSGPNEAATKLPRPGSVEPQTLSAPQPLGDDGRPAAPDAPAADGVSVPGYEVLGELGRGAMGVVYRARQLRLNRVVALKMILAGAHAGADELRRFRHEAEAVAQLQHPHIVQIFETGQHAGLPFFSLEFCPGGNLHAKWGGTPQPPGEAARLVEQLARGVA